MASGIDLNANVLTTVQILSATDASIDEGSDLESYVQDYDTSKLKILQGDDIPKPCWFTVRPVSRDDFAQICRSCDNDVSLVAEELFRVGVLRVAGLKIKVNGVKKKNGKKSKPREVPYLVRRESQGGRLDRLTDESFAIFPSAVRQEIGLALYRMSEITPAGGHEKNL